MAGKSLTLGDLVFRLGFAGEEAFVDALDKMLKRGEKESEDSGKKAGRGWSDQFKATFSGAAIGSFLGNVLSQAFQGALQATRQFVHQSLQDYQAYEQGLLELRRAGETNLQPFEDRMRSIAEQSGVFSRIDISQALSKLIGAGRDANEVYDLLEVAIKGATAEVNTAAGSFGDLAEMGMMLDNVLRALGLDISQAGRVMDVLAMSAQESNLTVSEMTNVIARVGPTANLAGIEVEQLAAMAATLSNNGWEASRIATGLNSVLNSLVSQPKNVREAFDSMGLSLVKSNGEMRDISEVMRNLGQLADGSGESLLFLGEGFDTFSLQVAAALGSNSEDLREFTEALYEAEGAADNLAQSARDTAAGAFKEMEARMADARIELGQQLMPIMLQLYESVFPTLVNWLGQVIDLWGQWELIITGTTRAIRQEEEALRQAQAASNDALRARHGEALANAQAEVDRLQESINELNRPTSWAPQGSLLDRLAQGARAEDLRELNAQLAEAIDLRDQLLQQATMTGGTLEDYFIPPKKESEDAAAGVDLVAEAFRNLETVQADLEAAREAWRTAGSAEEQAFWAGRVRVLQAEEKAILDLTRAETARSQAARTQEDPVVAQARRIAADLGRLKNLRDSERLSAEEYEEQVAGHLARLGKLYDQVAVDYANATTDEERNLATQRATAILQAEAGFLTELERLGKERTAQLRAESDERLRIYQEEYDRRQAAAAAQRRLDEAEYQHLRDIGEISLQQHLETLRTLQAPFTRGVDEEWYELQRQIDAGEAELLRAGQAREKERQKAKEDTVKAAEAAAKQEEEIARNRLRWELESGQITRQDYLDRLAEQLQKYDEHTNEWMRIRQEMHQLEMTMQREEEAAREKAQQELIQQLQEAYDARQAAAAAQRRLDDARYKFMVDTGEISREDHLENLQIRQLQLDPEDREQGLEWIANQREILRLQQEINDELLAEARRAADERAAIYQEEFDLRQANLAAQRRLEENEYRWQVAEGIITRDQHLENLHLLILQHDEFTDEWMANWREIRQVEQEAYRESLAAENARIAELIEAEGTLTEAKRLALLERLQLELDALDASVEANRAAIAAIEAAMASLSKRRGTDYVDPEEERKQLAASVAEIAMSFPRAVVEGIQQGDIGEALKGAMGTATDFFLDQMLKSILGPITEQLTRSIASSMAANTAGSAVAGAAGAASSLNPWMLALGAGALLLSLITSGRQRQQETARSNASVQRTVSSAPSVTYNLSAEVKVQPGASFGDPAFEARLRAFIEEVSVGLLRRVKREG